MEPYIPVACSLHSELELAILHRKPVHLQWQTPSASLQQETVMLTDIVTRSGEEYLLFTSEQGDAITLRLDHILKLGNL
ncbi:MAG TPA: transcriptional antiterminator, Rof [Gammaproteobacteria bacterium]|jgi:transcriptional antiterminator Rof (Rho-off)|nr:transcriptional antiterminator, Rof [Gammaproteobacteria bacterium]MBT3717674.1 transcriptional antiterminator, Rof [Gammaproteobacteria bacterium]MBT3845412.1 transcriptional antiterminator, Rof [Gammaproteobacteria bacterium]MBT4301493.1 transcriptional antiterminator, Rof [Gammaproteobacteria bacterium]MBT4549617.1 transcriptional antiterminator, Rof [Gammaproteobacteria bacterium]